MIENDLYMYVCCYYVALGGYEYSNQLSCSKSQLLACPSSAFLTLGSTFLIQLLLSLRLHTSIPLYCLYPTPTMCPPFHLDLLIYCSCDLQLMDERDCHVSSWRQHLIHTCIFGPMLLATLSIFLILSMGAYSKRVPPKAWDHTVHGGEKDTGKCSTTCKLKLAGRN
jgi:hypothetical protein